MSSVRAMLRRPIAVLIAVLAAILAWFVAGGVAAQAEGGAGNQNVVNNQAGFGTFSIYKYVQLSLPEPQAIPTEGMRAQQDSDQKYKFDVIVEYTLPDGKTAADYPGWDAPANPSRLTVSQDAATEFAPGFPAGTVVTLTEDVNSATPPLPVAWTPWFESGDPGVVVSDSGQVATVTIADGATLPIILHNYYAWGGSFAVTKTVTGDNADAFADVEYEFQYVCSNGQRGAVTTSVNKGKMKPEVLFPEKTTCTITETAKEPPFGYRLTQGEPQTITITWNQTVDVEFINEYTQIEGIFAIKKTLVAGGSSGSETFQVRYSCDAEGRTADEEVVAQTGQVEITAGQPTLVGRFTAGTKCKVVSETPADRPGYTLTTDLGEEITVPTKGGATIEVTNTYEKAPEPSPSPTPTLEPSPSASVSPSPSPTPSASRPAPTTGATPPVVKTPVKPAKPGLPKTGR